MVRTAGMVLSLAFLALGILGITGVIPMLTREPVYINIGEIVLGGLGLLVVIYAGQGGQNRLQRKEIDKQRIINDQQRKEIDQQRQESYDLQRQEISEQKKENEQQRQEYNDLQRQENDRLKKDGF